MNKWMTVHILEFLRKGGGGVREERGCETGGGVGESGTYEHTRKEMT